MTVHVFTCPTTPLVATVCERCRRITLHDEKPATPQCGCKPEPASDRPAPVT